MVPIGRAVSVHAGLGACLGMLCFLVLATGGATGALILAAPHPTLPVLASVMTSLFAVASGLTGFLFLASAERR